MRIMLSTLALLASGPALAVPPQIVADTAVTGSLVRQVLGEDGQVQVLLPRGASAHHHQIRPSDAQGMQDAGLLVWTGPELTPWLERPAASLAGGVAQLRLLQVPGTHLRSYAGAHDHEGESHEGHDHEGEEHGDEEGHDHAAADHDHDHDHDHGHDDGQGHDDHDHDHDHSGSDPHAWLDPANAQLWLTAIAESLATADPENAARYRDNATAAAQRIADLDRDLQAQLAPHQQDSFVVFHDAYGYFTEHYGLRPAIAVTLGDASTPSAARLASVREQVIASGASCAFPEYASDPKLVTTVIEGTETRLGAELSPEGGAAAPGADLYAETLRGLATAIDDCLSDR